MNYNIIATGSSGNAVLVNDNILIDCGVSFKKIEPYANQIRVVCITHRHSDHLKPSTVKTLHELHPAIRWITSEDVAMELLKIVDPLMIDIVYPLANPFGTGLTYFGLAKNARSATISAFPVRHNVPNIGFKLKLGDERVFYATDCGDLEGIEAKDFDLYLIEANYKTAEIINRAATKLESGAYTYEMDVIRNHLSEEQATSWLVENMGANSEYQFLHQHREEEENGRETDVYEEDN